MSQYQYYEFHAVDQPLTKEQMSELRACSSRARITARSFANEYNYGDFKGNPNKWIEKYFDAFLYLANWGTRWFMLRLPGKLVDQQGLSFYCVGENLSCRRKGEDIILSFRSENEEPEWAEGEGWLTSLLQIRADLMRGDRRALYLGWLGAVQLGEIDDDALEPPVPPGLGDLDASLNCLADFLFIDGDLIEAAAECSLAKETVSLTGKEIGEWLLNLSSKEKNEILLKFIDGNDAHLASELRQRAIIETRGMERPAEEPRRTVGDLRSRARSVTEIRKKKEAEQRAREKAALEREQAEKRRKRLESLQGREGGLWTKVDGLIATRLPRSYDEAVSLLQDLRDLAAMQGKSSDFSFRMRALHSEHTKKSSLVERFRKAKLL